MKQRWLLLIIAGAMLLTACKPTTKVTEEAELIYEEQLEKIDKNATYIDLDLSDAIRINAEITPFSDYGEELGIYEFQRQLLGVDTDTVLDNINKCRKKEDVNAEEIIISVGTDASVVGYGDLSEEQMNYATLSSSLLDMKIPLNAYIRPQFTESAKVQEEFSGYFTNLNSITVCGIETEKEYEEVVSQLTLYGGQDVMSSVGKNIHDIESKCFTGFYVVKCYEMVGHSKIPLKELETSCYKNYKLKEIPKTSYARYDDEVFCDTYNYVQAAFDIERELQYFHMTKNVEIDENPVRLEKIVDVCSVIDYFYQKMKTSQSKMIVSNIELFYTGIVVEEEDGLEDYIWPLWKITYYMPNVGTCANMYINAVTGKEL